MLFRQGVGLIPPCDKYRSFEGSNGPCYLTKIYPLFFPCVAEEQ